MPVYSEMLQTNMGPQVHRDAFIADVPLVKVEDARDPLAVLQAAEFANDAQYEAVASIAERLAHLTEPRLPEGGLWVPNAIQVLPLDSEFVISTRGILYVAAQRGGVTVSKKQAGPKDPLYERSVAYIRNTSESPKATVRPADDHSQRILVVAGKVIRKS